MTTSSSNGTARFLLARPDSALNRAEKPVFHMQHSHTPSSIIVVAAIFLAGCFASPEQRWEAFDEQMRQEVGVKTKDDYVREWGNPTKRVKLPDGGSTWTWEFRGYGGAQGWDKTLTFTPDGVLKEFHRDYWPKEN